MKSPGHKASTLRFYKGQMLRVLVHIQEHLDEDLELEELAGRACLSPYHFHRVFRGMLGEPLATHVRRLRLERAAGRLRQTRRSVIEIALDAGYESHEAFSRAFKMAFGLSPTGFRGANAASEQLPARSDVHFNNGGPLFDFRAVTHRLFALKTAIETVAPLRVAFVRHTGPYDECGAAWDRLGAWLGKEGYLGPGCRMLGVSYDDPESTPSSKVRYDACVTVDDSFQPAAGIGVQTVGGGDYVRATHFGPYAELKETYGRLMGQWLPRSGRQLRDAPCFEEYVNAPENTPPAELITDVYVPLAPPET